MSVTQLGSWRQPGCGERCRPRHHDPEDHESYGYALAIEDAQSQSIAVGPLTIGLDTGQVTVDGETVWLSPREWELISILARRIGCWIPTREIARSIWGETKRDELNARVAMGRLRWKLGTAGDLIVTRAFRGYLLRANLSDSLPSTVPKPVATRWARDWDACQWCKSTERKHAGRGLCSMCLNRQQRRAGKFL